MKRATRQILNVELQQGMLLKMYFLKNHFAVERDAIERDTVIEFITGFKFLFNYATSSSILAFLCSFSDCSK